MRASLVLLLAAFCTSCVPLAITGAAKTASVAAQERSVGAAVDDTGIYLTIKRLFLEKDVNDLLVNVGVRVVEGRVLLTGNVAKPETAVEAVRLSWLAEGVTEVINEIQVNDKESFQDYARDVWINAQIRSRLLFAKDIRSLNYSVETINGTVYLLGIAQNQTELDKALHIARTTKYVKRVISHVRLKDDPRRASSAAAPVR